MGPREARFDAVLLLANRDDLPRNLWLTHPDIVHYIETDEAPERVEAAVRELCEIKDVFGHMRAFLRDKLAENGLQLRNDSTNCWRFCSGLSNDSPDQVVATAILTNYLWKNGKEAWLKHRKHLEANMKAMIASGDCKTWKEAIYKAVKQGGFVFKKE